MREAIFALETTFADDVAVEGQISCNSDVSSGRSLRAIVGTANYSAFFSSGHSLTGSSAVSLVDLAGTWSTTGTPTAFKLDITDTASNAASLLMDLQISEVSKFWIEKNGSTNVGHVRQGGGSITASTLGFYRAGLTMGSSGAVSWGSAGVASMPDLQLYREQAVH